MKHITKEKLYFLLIAIFIMSCEGEDGQIGSMGEQGESGVNSLIKTSNENAGENCQNGGLKIEVGLDTNSNGILEENEIQTTNYTCNGIDGDNSLTTVTSESSGENCQNGGVKINSGLDTNNNGVLEENEITTTAYVCNGIDGNTGITKINSETPGTNCENGGLKIEYGLDTNNDGILNANEITYETYVCNGIDGNLSLVKITDEPDGANCENGGIKINSGIDSDNNGILEESEIDSTKYVCNGIGGISEVILDFNYSNFDGTNSTTGKVSNLFRINDFDLDNYSDFNFAKFSASIRSTDITASCIIELYDFSSNTVIAETLIQTNQTSLTFVENTVNFFDMLPTNSTDLGIKIRSSIEGIDVWCSNPRLTLSKE